MPLRSRRDQAVYACRIVWTIGAMGAGVIFAQSALDLSLAAAHMRADMIEQITGRTN